MSLHGQNKERHTLIVVAVVVEDTSDLAVEFSQLIVIQLHSIGIMQGSGAATHPQDGPCSLRWLCRLNCDLSAYELKKASEYSAIRFSLSLLNFFQSLELLHNMLGRFGNIAISITLNTNTNRIPANSSLY